MPPRSQQNTNATELNSLNEHFAPYFDGELRDAVEAPVAGSNAEAVFSGFVESFANSGSDSTLRILVERPSVPDTPIVDDHYSSLRLLKDDLETRPEMVSEDARRLIIELSDVLRNQVAEVFDTPEYIAPTKENVSEFWDTRDKSLKETPLDFIKRVYGSFMSCGLSKSDVNRVDPKLYRALYNWAGRGFSIPSDLFSEKRGRWARHSISPEDIEIFKKVNALKRK